MSIRRLSFAARPQSPQGAYVHADPAIKQRGLERMQPLFESSCGMSPSFSFSRFPDGDALITRGAEGTTQGLYLEKGVDELAGRLPIDLLGSPAWSDWESAKPVAPEPGHLPPLTVLTEHAGDLQKDGGRLERFLADVRALYAPRPGRQIVVIAADHQHVARLVRLACASLPRPLAERLTFTTHCADPRIGFQQVVGVCGASSPGFTAEERSHQYRVHDLTGGGQDSPAPETPDAWARKVVQQWHATGMTPKYAAGFWIKDLDEPKAHAPRADGLWQPKTGAKVEPMAENGTWPIPEPLPPTRATTGKLSKAGLDPRGLRLELRARLPEGTALPDAEVIVDAIVGLVPKARTREQDDPSPLYTLFAVLWPPPVPVPAVIATAVITALVRKDPAIFLEEDVLDVLVRAALTAPAHDKYVASLVGWLNADSWRNYLRVTQAGALAVYSRAISITPGHTSDLRLTKALEEIGTRLRDAEGEKFSPAMRQLWIDSVLDALFYDHGRRGVWFDAMPYLVQCRDAQLADEYGERVARRPWNSTDNREPALLGRAVAKWIRTSPVSSIWAEKRRNLLRWAHNQCSRDQRYAVAVGTELRQQGITERAASDAGFK